MIGESVRGAATSGQHEFCRWHLLWMQIRFSRDLWKLEFLQAAIFLACCTVTLRARNDLRRGIILGKE